MVSPIANVHTHMPSTVSSVFSFGFVSGSVQDAPRFLSAEACDLLWTRVREFATNAAETQVTVRSDWASDLRWARNRVWIASDRLDNSIAISCGNGTVETNVWDDASLRAAVRMAEREGQLANDKDPIGIRPQRAIFDYAKPTIWSEATYIQTPEMRNTIVQRLVARAERVGMLSAGYVSVLARGSSIRRTDGLSLYAPQTISQCSLTVRDPAGSGSGWAGASSYDWGHFDADKLAEIAVDKCLRSRNPVRIEPGRYTLIMEPQATFQLSGALLGHIRRAQETPGYPANPYYKGVGIVPTGKERRAKLGFSRLGERLLDPRITIGHDPMDPNLGVVPFDGNGEPYRVVTWFDQGVLTKLPTNLGYTLGELQSELAYPDSGAFRMSGGTTSIDEMIATTKRGLLVTRFSSLGLLDLTSLLMTGVTRDGLWLIEDGKISKAVKNLRFTESPLFVFNNVEQLGVPVSVFSPDAPAIVPPAKVRDFSFTSLVDAV